MQRDTFAGLGGRPSSQNRYTYTENDPINYIDPSGQSLTDLGDDVFGVLDSTGVTSDYASIGSTEVSIETSFGGPGMVSTFQRDNETGEIGVGIGPSVSTGSGPNISATVMNTDDDVSEGWSVEGGGQVTNGVSGLATSVSVEDGDDPNFLNRTDVDSGVGYGGSGAGISASYMVTSGEEEDQDAPYSFECCDGD